MVLVTLPFRLASGPEHACQHATGVHKACRKSQRNARRVFEPMCGICRRRMSSGPVSTSLTRSSSLPQLACGVDILRLPLVRTDILHRCRTQTSTSFCGGVPVWLRWMKIGRYLTIPTCNGSQALCSSLSSTPFPRRSIQLLLRT